MEKLKLFLSNTATFISTHITEVAIIVALLIAVASGSITTTALFKLFLFLIATGLVISFIVYGVGIVRSNDEINSSAITQETPNSVKVDHVYHFLYEDDPELFVVASEYETALEHVTKNNRANFVMVDTYRKVF